MNRTLLESARSMTYHAGLPKEFRAEAVNTATYTLNRSPTSSLNNATVRHSNAYLVADLKIFGCVAYAHIPNH